MDVSRLRKDVRCSHCGNSYVCLYRMSNGLMTCFVCRTVTNPQTYSLPAHKCDLRKKLET